MIGIAVLVTTLTAIYMARKPNVYAAAAKIQVDNEQTNPDLLTADRQRPMLTSDPSYFNTQLQLLWSDGLMRRTIKEHNLDANPEFQKARAEGSTSAFRSILRSVGLATDDKKKETVDSELAESGLATSEEIAEAVRLAPYVDMVERAMSAGFSLSGASSAWAARCWRGTGGSAAS